MGFSCINTVKHAKNETNRICHNIVSHSQAFPYSFNSNTTQTKRFISFIRVEKPFKKPFSLNWHNNYIALSPFINANCIVINLQCFCSLFLCRFPSSLALLELVYKVDVWYFYWFYSWWWNAFYTSPEQFLRKLSVIKLLTSFSYHFFFYFPN